MKRSPVLFAVALTALAAAGASADPWPQFGGPTRDAQSAETGLLKSWPAGGPKKLWTAQADLGIGYSCPAVTSDGIFVTGVFRQSGYVMALALDGKPRWKTKYGPEFTKSFLSSRTTPTVDGGRMYVMSGRGRIACLDAAEGKELWAVETERVYGAQQIRWGLAESPLICDEKVLCTPGGTKATIVALNKQTGKEIWSVNIERDKSAYCNPIRIKDGRKDIVVTMLERNVVGVDTATGQFLWQIPYAGPWGVHANSPIHHDGRIYVTSGYDTGGRMLELSPDGRSVKVLWKEMSLDTHHGGVVLVGGHVYGSNWISNARGNWLCLDWRSGKIKFDTKWENKGNLLVADGLIYCYCENGTVGLIKPDPSGWKPVSSFKITEGSGKHWAHLVISEGRLYVRHGEALMAYDIRAK